MHQFEQRKASPPSVNPIYYKDLPSLPFGTIFYLLGLISIDFELGAKTYALRYTGGFNRGRKFYCQIVSGLMWFFAIKFFVLLFIDDNSTRIMIGDLSIYWHQYRVYYLIPLFLIGIHAALVTSLFSSKERDLTWLLPFIAVSDHQYSERYYFDPILNHKVSQLSSLSI